MGPQTDCLIFVDMPYLIIILASKDQESDLRNYISNMMMKDDGKIFRTSKKFQNSKIVRKNRMKQNSIETLLFRPGQVPAVKTLDGAFF